LTKKSNQKRLNLLRAAAQVVKANRAIFNSVLHCLRQLPAPTAADIKQTSKLVKELAESEQSRLSLFTPKRSRPRRRRKFELKNKHNMVK
jgi:hypothetical protein